MGPTLTDLRHDPRIRGRRRLGENIARIDIDELVAAYRASVETAPHRHDRDKRYLVDGHDGRGGASERSREKVAAKAIFNDRSLVDALGLQVIDYEVPLRSRQSDAGIGEIDLLGLETAMGRPWLIELKVVGNNETPLEALIQALSYAAIFEANADAIIGEIAERARVGVVLPPVICILGDDGYWGTFSSSGVGPWREQLAALAAQVRGALGIDVKFMSLGEMSWTVDADDRARLVRRHEIRNIL